MSGKRGTHIEPYSAPEFAAVTGKRLTLGHLNVTISHPGSIFGIHYGDVPPGQAKYLHCVVGAVWDVVVDLRVGSPTFGSWEAVVLDDVNRHAVYLSEGLGHAYVCLSPSSTLVYICSQPFSSDREHRITPFDPAIGIDWPSSDLDGKPLTLSASAGDAGAPTLAEAIEAGRLPVASQGRNVHSRRD